MSGFEQFSSSESDPYADNSDIGPDYVIGDDSCKKKQGTWWKFLNFRFIIYVVSLLQIEV